MSDRVTGVTSVTRAGMTGTGRTRVTSMTRTQYSSERAGRWVSVGVRALGLATAVRATVTAVTDWLRGLVTAAGWLVLLWAVAGTTAGLVWGWTEFLLAGIASTLLIVVSIPFLLGRAAYRVTFDLTDDVVVAGQAAQAIIAVHNTSSRMVLPGRIDLPIGRGIVDLQVPLLRRGHEFSETVELPASRRGILDVGPATSSRADPLRLMRREMRWADVHTLYVHPRTVSIPSTSVGVVKDMEGSATRILTSEDISFHAVREYARGDAQRHVHWKSTAKTGTLMVRQFDETRRSTISVVLDLAADSYAAADEFEMAVSAAASLGVRAIRDGRDVEMVVSGHVPEFAKTSIRSIQRLRTSAPRALLDDCSGIEMGSDVIGLGAVSRMLAESSANTSLAVLVTGSIPLLATLQSAAMSFPRDASVLAIVCDPESPPSMRQYGGVRVISLGVLDDLRQLMVRRAAS